MTVSRDELVRAAAALRDELTEGNDEARALGQPGKVPLIYPMALDVIATTPALAAALAQKLSR